MWSFYFRYGKGIRAIWRYAISATSWNSYGHQQCSTQQIYFYISMRGILCLTFTNSMINQTLFFANFRPEAFIEQKKKEITMTIYVKSTLALKLLRRRRGPSPGLLQWSSLQTQRVKCEANFVSSGSKIFKRIWRRNFEPG